MTLTIYGCYRSRATRNIWLALELGLEFEHVPVIQVYRLPDPMAPDAPLHTRSPEFLAVNPNGHIPAIDDDGFRLWESLAINIYLSRKHGGPLAPADTREEGLAAMWALWAATEVETPALTIMQNRVGKPPEQRDAAAANAAVEALRRPFAVLDEALAKDGYLVGGRFTVADINVAEVMRYAQAAPELFETAPRVKAWLAACQSRPAFREMMRRRELEPA
ncbi:glutathione S-transferase family protein [Alsobacter sp. SYSU M60028]|uniref:Glutathione S-transferase family protein n=1 Tax=Alsobacter ponti TaxID=2962936 RepID=A0ABT1LGU2_9HYPH|nr:glutathione S-transferase family protein [Alsobacter ponti]MCP8940725.1 glutathione S-transferase family protein [Alsobacter ponti]